MISVNQITSTLFPSTFRLAKVTLICVTLLSADQFLRLALAEDTGGVPSPPNLIYPEGSEITFQWIYHCPRGAHCVFSCGPTSANAVIDLTIYLGTAPIGDNLKALALFYFYSTPLIPRNNGFRISSGPTASFYCDVNGMDLDYSGPPKGPSGLQASERH